MRPALAPSALGPSALAPSALAPSALAPSALAPFALAPFALPAFALPAFASAGPPSPCAITAPGGAAHSAVLSSALVLASPAGPTTAISAGPETIASATARPQPAARGNRAAI